MGHWQVLWIIHSLDLASQIVLRLLELWRILDNLYVLLSSLLLDLPMVNSLLDLLFLDLEFLKVLLVDTVLLANSCRLVFLELALLPCTLA